MHIGERQKELVEIMENEVKMLRQSLKIAELDREVIYRKLILAEQDLYDFKRYLLRDHDTRTLGVSYTCDDKLDIEKILRGEIGGIKL